MDKRIEIVYFYSTTCSVCDSFYEKLQVLVNNQFREIHINRINAATDLNLRPQYGVFTAPLAIVLIEGKEYFRFSAYVSIIEVEERLQRLVSIVG